MHKTPDSATSEMYKLKMSTFKNSQLEEFLAFLKSFRISINGIQTTSVSGRIKYLRKMLHGEALIDFDKLASQNNVTKNAHLKHIKEVLLGYSPLSMPHPRKITRRATQ